MERVTIRQAASELHLTMETVRILMQQGVLDIGYVKVNECGRCTYIIFRSLLDKELERLK
jgi:predicted PP-loop superfamily ATPase